MKKMNLFNWIICFSGLCLLFIENGYGQECSFNNKNNLPIEMNIRLENTEFIIEKDKIHTTIKKPLHIEKEVISLQFKTDYNGGLCMSTFSYDKKNGWQFLKTANFQKELKTTIKLSLEAVESDIQLRVFVTNGHVEDYCGLGGGNPNIKVIEYILSPCNRPCPPKGLVGTSKILDSNSEDILINLQNPLNISPIILFPNPSIGNSSLRFNLDHAQNVQIYILDSFGRLIQSTSNQYIRGENYFEIRNIPPGAYHVLIRAGQFSKQLKMIVID